VHHLAQRLLLLSIAEELFCTEVATSGKLRCLLDAVLKGQSCLGKPATVMACNFTLLLSQRV